MTYRDTGRDNNFNLLRMLAATGVLVSHAYPISLGPQASEPLSFSLRGLSLGSLCVMIFFAISGFFIARSFDRTSSLRRFLRARALRLFPGLFVALFLTVLVGACLTTAGSSAYWAQVPSYLLRNATLFFPRYDLPGVLTDTPFGPAINGSLWTLNYEVLCYSGVVLCGLLGLLSRPRLFLLWAGGFAMLYGVTTVGDLHIRLEKLVTLALPFTTGMALWVWRDQIALSPRLAALGGAVAAASWPTPIFLPVFTIALSYAVFVIGQTRLPYALAYNRLGDYSYGTYIYAFPIQQLLAAAGISLPLWNMTLALPMTLACAVLSWHLIEAPALRWKSPGRYRGTEIAPRQSALRG